MATTDYVKVSPMIGASQDYRINGARKAVSEVLSELGKDFADYQVQIGGQIITDPSHEVTGGDEVLLLQPVKGAC